MKCNVTNAKGEDRQWVQALGRVTRETFQVRGSRRFVIHLDYFQANVAIDPTMIDARGIESEEDYIRKLLKEIPEECNSIGLDVKGYWVEENQVPRLRAWEGRRIRDGRRIDETAKQELIASSRNGSGSTRKAAAKRKHGPTIQQRKVSALTSKSARVAIVWPVQRSTSLDRGAEAIA